MKTEKQKSRVQTILKCAALGGVLLAISGCVVDPYPPPPPPAAYAPAPAYYGGPYSYYDYPAYYPYYAGPAVGFGVGFGDGFHGGYHHWH